MIIDNHDPEFSQRSLFIRRPVSLSEVPRPDMSREEVKLGYESEQVRVGGMLFASDPDEGEKYVIVHRIKILDHVIESRELFYGVPAHEIVPRMVNTFLADPSSVRDHPAEVKWLRENAAQLNASNKYWRAVQHREEVDRQIDAHRQLGERIRKAEMVASMNAHMLLQDPTQAWSSEDRQRLALEFGFTQEELDRDR